MGRTSSITMRSMVGILGRAPAVDEKVFFCLFFIMLWNDEVCDMAFSHKFSMALSDETTDCIKKS